MRKRDLINVLTYDLPRREQKKLNDVLTEDTTEVRQLGDVIRIECDICGTNAHKAVYVDKEIYFLCDRCFIDELEVCPSCDEYITRENNVKCGICGKYSHSDCTREDPTNDDPMRNPKKICDDCYEMFSEQIRQNFRS